MADTEKFRPALRAPALAALAADTADPAMAAGTIYTDTIAEVTSAAGVTIDGVLLKDGGLTAAGALDLNGAELILDADADTSITADTGNQIDIKINGADDFQFTANTFTALSGSTIKANTIAETTGAAGVTVDGVLLKDGVNQGTLHSGNVFLSGELTGNGGVQATAHGLGSTPVLVYAIPSNLSGGAYVVTYGTHDATNVEATVTTGEKYRMVAFK
jgi:hypothetical protein